MAIYKKRIWITGNGFLGKNIFSVLNKNKYEICISKKNEIDLFEYHKIVKHLKNFKPDIILQSAGKVGGIIRNKKEKFELLNDNIRVSSNLISSSYEILPNVRFLNFVSSCIYPNNKITKIKETDFSNNFIEKSSENYALAKIISLKMSKLLFEKGKEFINIVPSNLYGPHDNFNPFESHVIPGLIQKMSNSKKEILLPGSGIAKRDFVYIEDFALAIKKIIASKKILSDTYNISSNETISIKKLITMIQKLIKFDQKIKFKNDDNNGTLYKCLSSDNFRREFKWKEKYTLEEGLNKTIKWYTARLL